MHFHNLTTRKIYSQKGRKVHWIFSLFAAVFVLLSPKIESYTLRVRGSCKNKNIAKFTAKTKCTFP